MSQKCNANLNDFSSIKLACRYKTGQNFTTSFIKSFIQISQKFLRGLAFEKFARFDLCCKAVVGNLQSARSLLPVSKKLAYFCKLNEGSKFTGLRLTVIKNST